MRGCIKVGLLVIVLALAVFTAVEVRSAHSVPTIEVAGPCTGGC